MNEIEWVKKRNHYIAFIGDVKAKGLTIITTMIRAKRKLEMKGK